jgi:hypothetical protein
MSPLNSGDMKRAEQQDLRRHVTQVSPRIIKRGERMIRSLLLAAGWSAAILVLYASLWRVDFDVNFLTWMPGWSAVTVVSILAIALSWLGMLLLSRSTPDRLSLVASLAACLVLVVVMIHELPGESLNKIRTTASPAWYRWSRTIASIVPLSIWRAWLLRFRRLARCADTRRYAGGRSDGKPGADSRTNRE